MKPTMKDIEAFCEALTNVTNDRFQKMGDTVNSASFEVSRPVGKVYARIVQKSFVSGSPCSGGSAHCFVKLEDGSLWKPAGWKGPAKNFSRGSVFELPTNEYAGRC